MQAQSDQGGMEFSYTAYGHDSSAASETSLLNFNGEYPDPITHNYLLGNGYRAYNPVTMRFQASDSFSPFGAGGLNSYAYCLGDPMNMLDPTGHAGVSQILLRRNNRRQVRYLEKTRPGYVVESFGSPPTQSLDAPPLYHPSKAMPATSRFPGKTPPSYSQIPGEKERTIALSVSQPADGANVWAWKVPSSITSPPAYESWNAKAVSATTPSPAVAARRLQAFEQRMVIVRADMRYMTRVFGSIPDHLTEELAALTARAEHIRARSS